MVLTRSRSSVRTPASTADAKSPKTPATTSPRKKRQRRVPPSPRLSKSPLTHTLVAAINPEQPYLDLEVNRNELRPSATLTTGQCFHWAAVDQEEPKHDGTEQQSSAWGSHNAIEWVGVLRLSPNQSAVVAIRETQTTTLYRPLTNEVPSSELKAALYKYFQLHHSLKDLYGEWSSADPRLKHIAECIPGVRIVDQDPWECLVSFICSSNNNIPRITRMLSDIRKQYGRQLLQAGDLTWHAFPNVDDLQSRATDQALRANCGLGYRSKYILETLRILNNLGGESYLQNLRKMNDPAMVQEKLCEFHGVGRKVADCVALFSLQQHDAIPVDVHVWNIARRDYDPENRLADVKSLTAAVYNEVGSLFRNRFPNKAGWAHSLLFVAELPSFRPVLPDHIVREMDQFRLEEQKRKKNL